MVLTVATLSVMQGVMDEFGFPEEEERAHRVVLGDYKALSQTATLPVSSYLQAPFLLLWYPCCSDMCVVVIVILMMLWYPCCSDTCVLEITQCWCSTTVVMILKMLWYLWWCDIPCHQGPLKSWGQSQFQHTSWEWTHCCFNHISGSGMQQEEQSQLRWGRALEEPRSRTLSWSSMKALAEAG